MTGSRAAVAVFLLTLTGRVWGLTVAELQRNIREQDRKLESIQFEYIQEMRSSQSRETAKSQGRAYFQKPQSVRIDQESPERQVIVTQGKTVFIYTPRFNQVLKDTWKNWSRKNSFLPGLFGSSGTLDRLEKDYAWTLENGEKLNGEDTVVVRLKPAAEGEDLKLWLGAADFVPRKAQVSMGGGSLVTTLRSLRMNAPLEPGIFDFSPPKNASVIKVP